jgi:excisionase family DNA binding protein
VKDDVVYAPQLMTLREAAQVLHLSRQTTWRRTRDGTIRVVRIGPSIRVSVSEINRLLGGDTTDA